MTDARSAAGSQTLGRGIRLLEVLAASERPQSIDELAASISVHRSVAYRLLRTLEDHGLIARDAGRISLGAGVSALAAGVARDLQQLALPELSDAANELGMTCLLAVQLDAHDAVTLVSASPRQSVAVVSYRPGHRHPLTRGAPGKAILAGLPEAQWPAAIDDRLREELREARERGFARSHDEVVPSLFALAVPLQVVAQPPAAIAAIHVAFTDAEPAIVERLALAARRIEDAYGA